MTKKKKRRGRPPGVKNKSKAAKVKAAPKGKGKARAAKKTVKARRPAPSRKAAAPKASTRKKVPLDLVAGKFVIARAEPGVASGVLTGASLLTVPLAPAFVVDGPVEAAAVYATREDAKAVVARFFTPPAPPAADDGLDLGFETPADAIAFVRTGGVPDAAHEPLAGMEPHNEGALPPEAAAAVEAFAPAPLPPTVPVVSEFCGVVCEVRPMRDFFATSYEIETSNELTRTVKWKKDATTLGQAVRATRDELAKYLKAHEKELKEFDRRVAEARKANLADVNSSRRELDKFLKAANTYA